MSDQRYNQRGVSASKEDVHNAIKNIDKGIFPKAFVKSFPIFLVVIQITATSCMRMVPGTNLRWHTFIGVKLVICLFGVGLLKMRLIMDIDDLLCVGATDNILLSSTIGRNKLLIPGEVISAIINGTSELCEELSALGVNIFPTGGETADVGDLVRTIIVDSTVACRMKRSDDFKRQD